MVEMTCHCNQDLKFLSCNKKMYVIFRESLLGVDICLFVVGFHINQGTKS